MRWRGLEWRGHECKHCCWLYAFGWVWWFIPGRSMEVRRVLRELKESVWREGSNLTFSEVSVLTRAFRSAFRLLECVSISLTIVVTSLCRFPCNLESTYLVHTCVRICFFPFRYKTWNERTYLVHICVRICLFRFRYKIAAISRVFLAVTGISRYPLFTELLVYIFLP